ncbi:MAG: hypothetical protein A2W23_05960 [Planctomycetes bacterium RBG_16_43_13]|nr:MAG: hypothetical protein A2W23_05960 [Planctomycetes bacterium RBG_16_43_13]
MKEIFPGIAIDGKVRFGKPVLKGTRVDVDLVIGKLASGMSFEDLQKEYGLTRRQILTALKYVASTLKREVVKATS